MAERVVYQHEVYGDQKVSIMMNGEIDLDVLECIEGFCHRQRFRICQRMAEKERPVVTHDEG